jgi:adenylyltransferase/sulfurtransferase
VDPTRYARQTCLPEIGEEGQRRLLASRVVVMGCGALGGACATMLARAGVGRLVVVDRDIVDRSNLQRQVLFDESDVASGLPKAEAARVKLRAANPDISVESVVADVDASNVLAIVGGADLVVDGADNLDLRLLVNEACVKLGVPFVHGAVLGAYGVQFTVVPGSTACYACLFDPEPAPGTLPTCEAAGVLAATVVHVASLQVAEAMKLLTGNSHRLRGTLASRDLWTGDAAELSPRRRPDCVVCGHRRFDRLEGRAGSRTTVLCGRDTVMVSPPAPGRVDLASVASRLPPGACVAANPHALTFVADGCRVALFPDGRAIVSGTNDPARARGLLARLVGL